MLQGLYLVLKISLLVLVRKRKPPIFRKLLEVPDCT